jgi:hypothetical protein
LSLKNFCSKFIDNPKIDQVNPRNDGGDTVRSMNCWCPTCSFNPSFFERDKELSLSFFCLKYHIY